MMENGTQALGRPSWSMTCTNMQEPSIEETAHSKITTTCRRWNRSGCRLDSKKIGTRIEIIEGATNQSKDSRGGNPERAGHFTPLATVPYNRFRLSEDMLCPLALPFMNVRSHCVKA